jgi:hypothetical protein
MSVVEPLHPEDDPFYRCKNYNSGTECVLEPLCEKCAAREAAIQDWEDAHAEADRKAS